MGDKPLIGPLDLRQIRLLYLLLTQRSITRVADEVGVSQPAVSIAFSRLRQVFGDPLLVRAGAGMVPTERGTALIAPVSTLLDAYERLAVEPDSFEPTLSLRRFSIATPNYLTALLLPPLMSSMIAAAPNIRITARTALSTDDPTTGLANGSTDLLIANWSQISDHLKSTALCDDTPVCIMSASHPFALLDALSLPEYLSLDHISPTAAADARFSPIDDELARLGERRRISVVVPDYLMLPRIVARTRLVLTTGAAFGALAAENPAIKVVAAPPELTPIHFRMLWHVRSHTDPAHQWLRRLVRSAARSIFEPTGAR